MSAEYLKRIASYMLDIHRSLKKKGYSAPLGATGSLSKQGRWSLSDKESMTQAKALKKLLQDEADEDTAKGSGLTLPEYYRIQNSTAPHWISYDETSLQQQTDLMIDSLITAGILPTEQAIGLKVKLFHTVNVNFKKRLSVVDTTTSAGVQYYVVPSFAKARELMVGLIYPSKHAYTELKYFLQENGVPVAQTDEEFLKLRLGFDVGHGTAHGDDLRYSNVTSAYKTLIFNKMRGTKEYNSLAIESAQFAQFMEDLNKNSANIADLLGVDAEILLGVIDLTIDFARFSKSDHFKATMAVSTEAKKGTIRSMGEVAKKAVARVYPQLAAKNQELGRTVEKVLANRMEDPNFWASFIKELENPDSIVFRSFANIQGSPSIKQILERQLYEELQYGKTKPASVRSKTTKSGKPKSLKTGNLSSAIKKKKAETDKAVNQAVAKLKASASKPRVMPARDLKGRFISLLNLKNILGRLPEQVAKNMGRGSATDVLNYRTGRFAMSTEATNVSATREGMIQVYYTYMKYPYQTFEPGFAQGKLGRDPRTLIEGSIRQLLRPYVLNKLQVIRE